MYRELINIGKKSKKAFSINIDTSKKNKVLKDYCYLINQNKRLIINQNKKDIHLSQKKKLNTNLINRLVLNEKKISNIVNTIKSIIKLKDPTSVILEKIIRPNGFHFFQIDPSLLREYRLPPDKLWQICKNVGCLISCQLQHKRTLHCLHHLPMVLPLV